MVVVTFWDILIQFFTSVKTKTKVCISLHEVPLHKKTQNDFYTSGVSLLLISLLASSFTSQSVAQSITLEDMVTYSMKSNFIKEFEIPLEEHGLKGIAVDAQGNPWFYHSTNKTSTIIKLEPDNGLITSYNVEGDTVVDVPIINLAGGQLVFDETRSVIWFTDARTNSIGKLDTQSGKMELVEIPTSKAGPMGIALSPDGKSVWVAEIIANKIAKLDLESNSIVEYFTGEETGPTLLAFDDTGILWVTLSYSNSLLRVQTGLLGSIISSGMSAITLPKPDTFSPFGVAFVADNGAQNIFVSDHSSSRVISSDVNSNLQSYVSYWTSPSKIYPTTLPTQIVSDKLGNIYFSQHGGNRISKIDRDGVMTEYDIPTGPLSTAVFIAVSEDGKKIWFTEWASNKVGSLDTTIPVPFNIQVKDNQMTLDRSGPKTLDVVLKADSNSTSVSLDQVGLAVIGMSESGLKGITYSAQPQWINMQENQMADSQISLKAGDDARPGHYTLLVRATVSEKDQLLISQLYPIQITLDVPEPITQSKSLPEGKSDSSFGSDVSLNEITKFLAILVAVVLIGFLIYTRIKRSKISKSSKQET